MLERLNNGSSITGDLISRAAVALSSRGELPDVLIVGAQKAGTSSLYSYLVQHPRVSAAKRKEVHFFDKNFGKGERWYRSHFRRAAPDRLLIEASPYYLFHPAAAERAAALVPQAKLIVLLREPVSRAYSHYQHEVARGFETLSFEEALASEPERLEGTEERLVRGPRALSFEHQHFSYRSRGLYAEQIERWLVHYPRSAVLFLKAEDMFASVETVFDMVCGFLGLSPIQLADKAPRHQRSYAPMARRIRDELASFYNTPNREVAALTGISW